MLYGILRSRDQSGELVAFIGILLTGPVCRRQRKIIRIGRSG